MTELLLIMLVFGSAIIRYQLATNIFPENHIIRFVGLKDKVSIEGYVVSPPVERDNVFTCEISTEIIDIADTLAFFTSGKILLKGKAVGMVLKKGDRVSIFGRLKKPAGERNPGEFNYQKYLASKKVYGMISVYNAADIQVITPPKKTNFFVNSIYNSRQYLEHAIDRGFSGQAKALLKGLILGERGEITPEIKEAFSTIGVMHVLAVSGLHVGFIVTIFALFFRLLPFSRRWQTIATMLGALFYMLIVGFKAPVVRATLIVELYFFGQLIQRRSNPLNLVATAAFIILLINPLELFQASFQLSFIAFISIIYFYKILKQNTGRIAVISSLTDTVVGNYIIQLLLVSIAASCGTLPLTIYYFEKLPVISIFMNIAIIPLVFIIIISGFCFIIFAGIIWPVANLIARLSTYLLDLLITLTTTSAKLSFSSIPIYNFQFLHIIVVYWFIFLIFNIHRKLCQKALLISIFSLFLFISNSDVFQLPTCVEVTFIDVGQGDAALVRFPENRTILIDGGDKNEWMDAGKQHIVPYLQRQGVKKIDAVILSHADNDHIGGIPHVLRQVPVDRIYDNGVKAETGLFNLYSKVIDSLKIEHLVLTSTTGDSLYEKYGLFVMHPGNEIKTEGLNNSSIVVKLVYGDVSFLFTGDIEKEAEAELLHYGAMLKSDVLKTPHHGSKTSSTLAFLKFVQPKCAVISVGEYNRFNHPSESVLNRLDSLGIEIIRTDENGAVIFRTDGRKLERLR